MKMYKVLTNDMRPPFIFGEPYEIGKKYVCHDFDSNQKIHCSRGFYATDLEGIAYSYNGRNIYTFDEKAIRRVFEVEVGGRSTIVNKYKQRFEEMIIIREIGLLELKKLLREVDCSYNLHDAIFPYNPFDTNDTVNIPVTEDEIKLLREWASAEPYVYEYMQMFTEKNNDYVMSSIVSALGASIDGLVWKSIWDLHKQDIGDGYIVGQGFAWEQSVNAVKRPVISSIINAIDAYACSILRPSSKYPESMYLRCLETLWVIYGRVPSFDGTTWRLHSGKNAKIVFEIKY